MCEEGWDVESAGRVYVILVSTIIGFIGITSQVFVFWDYLGGFTPLGLTVLGTFNFCLGLLCYNYYLCCTVEPGSVPQGWEPPLHGVNVYELKRDTQRPRYCRTCKGYKPPRTHHCSDCQRCVLKMDHHCPWVNNCIGHYNHGHFLRFIYSVDVTCSIALAIHSCRMYELVIDVINNTYPARQPTQTEVTFLILNISLLLLVLIFVGALSVYHVILIVSNTTSIERKERKRVQRLVEKRQIPPCEYPYDLGVVDNLKSLFGNNILLWWVPKAMKGHGLDFPIKKGLEPPVYWPPPGYHVQAGPNAYPGEVSNILYKGKGGGMMVTAEIDDDGETVIRQYNRAGMDHPELLEGGGEVGTDWRAKSAKDDVSTSGEEFTDDSSTDSDDDIEDGFPEMTGVTGGWSSALNSQFMIPGQGGQHGVGLASEVSPEYTQSLNKHRLQRHVPGYHSNGMRPLGSEEGGREAESDDDDDQPLISVMRKKNTASIKTKLS